MTRENRPKNYNILLKMDKFQQEQTENNKEEPLILDAQQDIGGEPISFKEAIKFGNGTANIELYSSTLQVHQLAEVLIQLLDYSKQHKQSPSYTQ